MLDDRDIAAARRTGSTSSAACRCALEIGPRDIAGRHAVARGATSRPAKRNRASPRGEFVGTIGRRAGGDPAEPVRAGRGAARTATRATITSLGEFKASSRPRTPTSRRSTAASRCATLPKGRRPTRSSKSTKSRSAASRCDEGFETTSRARAFSPASRARGPCLLKRTEGHESGVVFREPLRWGENPNRLGVPEDVDSWGGCGRRNSGDSARDDPSEPV